MGWISERCGNIPVWNYWTDFFGYLLRTFLGTCPLSLCSTRSSHMDTWHLHFILFPDLAGDLLRWILLIRSNWALWFHYRIKSLIQESLASSSLTTKYQNKYFPLYVVLASTRSNLTSKACWHLIIIKKGVDPLPEYLDKDFFFVCVVSACWLLTLKCKTSAYGNNCLQWFWIPFPDNIFPVPC